MQRTSTKSSFATFFNEKVVLALSTSSIACSLDMFPCANQTNLALCSHPSDCLQNSSNVSPSKMLRSCFFSKAVVRRMLSKRKYAC